MWRWARAGFIAAPVAIFAACAASSTRGAPDPAPTRTATGALVWQEQTTLAPADGASADYFGTAVAIDGERILVGAPGARAAYTFTRAGSGWFEEQRLSPPGPPRASSDARHAFGSAVALSGDLAVVGSADELVPVAGGGVTPSDGRVVLFIRSGSAFEPAGELLPDGALGSTTRFGAAVATSPDLLVVGAPGGVEAVYVYAREAAGAHLSQRLDRVLTTNTELGASLALGPGDALAVGAPAEGPGAVYVFERSSGAYGSPARVAPADLPANARFGEAVCFAGDALVASGQDGSTGILRPVVRVFTRSAGDGFVLEQTLPAAAGTLACAAGAIVAGDAVAGVSIFRREDGGSFEPSASFVAPEGQELGRSVALGGDVLVAGAPHDTWGAIPPGGARVYRLALLDGETCTTNEQCLRGACVDGVCCETACGGGVDDCQACSVVAGSSEDGKCRPLASGHVCRPARGGCDVVDRCDGVGVTCPADEVAPNGAACGATGTGLCSGGACSEGEAPVVDSATERGAPSSVTDGGCSLSRHPRGAPRFTLLWGIAIVIVMTRARRGRRGRRSWAARVIAAMAVSGVGALWSVEAAAADAPTWTEAGSVLATPSSVGDLFGYSVAIEGRRAVVGAPGLDAAWVFDRDASGTWTMSAKLAPTDLVVTSSASDTFGVAVAIDGDTVAVGTREKYEALDDAGSVRALGGRVYVFTRSAAGDWTQSQIIAPSDGAAEDHFGATLALQGQRLVVGASGQLGLGAADPLFSLAGAAYVFRRTGAGPFEEEQKLVAKDRRGGDAFGSSVALRGATIAVGAIEDQGWVPNARPSATGSVHVFSYEGTAWTEEARLAPPGLAVGAKLGQSVAVDGDYVVAGAPADATGRGSAFVFHRSSSGEWSVAKKLSPTGSASGFGAAVALSGAHALVGAPAFALEASASMHVFSMTDSWSLVTSFTGRATGFGRAIAADGAAALVGAAAVHASLALPIESAYGAAGGATFFHYASPNGASCTLADDCRSGACVDGVCCDSACGDGDPTDCQACSAAAGAELDGVCSPLRATCRPKRDACDVEEVCDGVSPRCPPDAVVENGAACGDGLVCVAGTCSDRRSAAEGARFDPVDAPDEGCSAGGGSTPTAPLLLVTALALGGALRRRPTGRRTRDPAGSRRGSAGD